MKALFIGRFQPFHKGHLQLLQTVAKNYDELIIGIGSSQYSHTVENPFTLDEREKMIEASLAKKGVKNYRIVPIPDIHNYRKWASHVVSIISDFDVILTNNTLTKRLFSEKGYSVKETPVFDRSNYSGEVIRRKMTNDELWRELVPEPAYRIIKDIHGVQRLKELSTN